jgi:hypothetical protein
MLTKLIQQKSTCFVPYVKKQNFDPKIIYLLRLLFVFLTKDAKITYFVCTHRTSPCKCEFFSIAF